ncbi:hypothetical protein FRB91_004788 [Serendipita sp. 411]|nr:hypothetical protein FRB91_004788 [Serendipita sp. 411]
MSQQLRQQQMTIEQAQSPSSVVSQQPSQKKTMSLGGEDAGPMRLRGGDGHHPIAACCCFLCICCGLEELCCLEVIDDCLSSCTCLPLRDSLPFLPPLRLKNEYD